MGLSDTTTEAATVQRDAWRRMGPDRRVETAVEMSEEIRQLTLDGLRDRHPGADEDQLVLALIELWHGPELAASVAQRDRVV